MYKYLGCDVIIKTKFVSSYKISVKNSENTNGPSTVKETGTRATLTSGRPDRVGPLRDGLTVTTLPVSGSDHQASVHPKDKQENEDVNPVHGWTRTA